MVARVSVVCGERFGRLSVISELPARRSPGGQIQRRFLVGCDCGEQTEVFLSSLRNGNTTSCGCYHREMTSKLRPGVRHDMSATPTYQSWAAMRERVAGKDADKARNYKDRGITQCERWNLFENFLADMGERPKGMTLDRIDNNGNYEPNNCRWATNRVQSSNKRTNQMVTVSGEKVCLLEASRRLSIDPGSAPDMARREGVSLQEAIDTFAARGGGRSLRVHSI